MKLLLLFLVVLVVALFASVVLRAAARQRNGGDDWPFVVQKPLSRVEQILYYRMVQTLPEQVVLAQVPLSRFLRVRKGRTWREWHNRISQKSVDFLVCERDFTIIAAVELDDASHDGGRRSTADATKSRAFAAARVPLVRWRVTALPTAETIRSVIGEIRREQLGDVFAAPPVAVKPGLNASRIEASNDPTMVSEEGRL